MITDFTPLHPPPRYMGSWNDSLSETEDTISCPNTSTSLSLKWSNVLYHGDTTEKLRSCPQFLVVNRFTDPRIDMVVDSVSGISSVSGFVSLCSVLKLCTTQTPRDPLSQLIYSGLKSLLLPTFTSKPQRGNSKSWHVYYELCLWVLFLLPSLFVTRSPS